MDREYCPNGELSAHLCYKKTKPGFRCAATLCTDLPDNPPISKIGRLPDKCPDDRELHGRLCYPKCPKNYKRYGDNLEFCTEICPPGFTRIGIGGCVKPVKWLPVGKSTLDPNYGECPDGKKYKDGMCYNEIIPEFPKE